MQGGLTLMGHSQSPPSPRMLTVSQTVGSPAPMQPTIFMSPNSSSMHAMPWDTTLPLVGGSPGPAFAPPAPAFGTLGPFIGQTPAPQILTTLTMPLQAQRSVSPPSAVVMASGSPPPSAPAPGLYRTPENQNLRRASISPTVGSSHTIPPPKTAGVGIYWLLNDRTGGAYVERMIPGASAERCGVIKRFDEIVAVGSQGMKPTNVDGAGLDALFNLIVGHPGTFVQLFFRRGNRGEYEYDVELMRGSPEYIDAVQGAEDVKETNSKAAAAASEKSIVASDDKGQGEDPHRRINQLENMVRKLSQRLQDTLESNEEKKKDMGEWKKEVELLTKQRDIATRGKEEFERRLKETGAQLEASERRLQEAEASNRSLRMAAQSQAGEKAELGELRLEIAKRQERDGRVGSILQNGHRAMQDALREQQLAINSALDVIPAFDAMHASAIKALAEGSRELATFQTVSHPRDPHLYRAPAISLQESLPRSLHNSSVVYQRDRSPLRRQNSPSLGSMASPGTFVSAASPSKTAYVTSTAYRTPQSWTASTPQRTMSPHRRSVSPPRRSGSVREDYA